MSYAPYYIQSGSADRKPLPAGYECECWRCGTEGDAVRMPMHPDGGGFICHTCWSRMFDERSAEYRERMAKVRQSLDDGQARLLLGGKEWGE